MTFTPSSLSPLFADLLLLLFFLPPPGLTQVSDESGSPLFLVSWNLEHTPLSPRRPPQTLQVERVQAPLDARLVTCNLPSSMEHPRNVLNLLLFAFAIREGEGTPGTMYNVPTTQPLHHFARPVYCPSHTAGHSTSTFTSASPSLTRPDRFSHLCLFSIFSLPPFQCSLYPHMRGGEANGSAMLRLTIQRRKDACGLICYAIQRSMALLIPPADEPTGPPMDDGPL